MEDYFKERDIKSNLNRLREVFNLISLTRQYKIIGSSNLKNIRYNSDFDLADFYNNKKPNVNKIVKYFQHIYKTLDVKKYFSYITDFKCGLNSDGEPLKWTKSEVLKNKKLLLDGSYITLGEAIAHKSTIKIDVITFVNGTFIEISENYYIKLGDISNFDTNTLSEKQIIQSIKDSEKEEIKDDNYNKALKRQFSWRYAKNKDDRKLMKLIDFFNSSVGILNKARSDLDVLLLLIEKKISSVNMSQLLSAIDIIKFQCSYNTISPKGDKASSVDDFTNDFLKIEKIKSRIKLFNALTILRNKIYDVVNEYSKNFYKKL